MEEELEKDLTELCEAFNKVNDTARRIMASYGVKTNEALFVLTENKDFQKQMSSAALTAFEAEKLNILFGSLSKMIH